MVTVENVQYIEGSQTGDFEFKGLSTDTKPTVWKGSVIAENSLFLEVDTGDVYYFDGSSWAQVGA